MAQTFSEIVKQEKPTLVDFYADWCGPCKMMKPILEDVKSRIGENATILKIDVDRTPQVMHTYNIQGVPTLILFKNGEIKWRQAGVVLANDLEKIINQYVSAQ
ncbi:MAG: thioredoxin [Cyclobacteriaceae bacterium]